MSYAGPFPLAPSTGGTGASTYATSDGTIFYNGTDLVTTGVGTAGQVLTSTGAGTPSFSSAGSWTWISTFDFSSTPGSSGSVILSSSFNSYALVFSNVTVNSATSVLLRLHAPSALTSGYFGGVNAFPYNSTTLLNQTATNGFLFIPTPTVGTSFSGIIYVLNNQTNGQVNLSGMMYCTPNGGVSSLVLSSGIYPTNETVSSLEVRFSSGSHSFTAGTFSGFGIRES